MDIVNTIALSMGTAWASGINLYAAMLMLGYLGATGQMTLPPGLEVLSDPLVIFAAAIMYFIEFFADKMPGVDTGWDILHTFIRIPAGATLAMGAIGPVEQPAQIAAMIIGGTLAAQSHFIKTSSRVIINTSPEPVTNWAASLTEDAAVIGGLWTALHYPTLFLVLLSVFIMVSLWLLPRFWSHIVQIFRKIRDFFAKILHSNTKTKLLILPAPKANRIEKQ